jgi:hypothetical protein
MMSLVSGVLWLAVLLFILAQNLQVALYGVVFSRFDQQEGVLHRILQSFKDPLFLAALILLSIATAALRLWLFPHAGVARTHVITSAAVVLSFAVFSLVFSEAQPPARYLGAFLCAAGIFLVAR